MNKKENLINNIILLVATIACVFLITFIANKNYNAKLFNIVLYFIIGAIVIGLINTIFHELGHVIQGKKSGFKFASMKIWLLLIRKEGKKLKFSFNKDIFEAGSTEMYPISYDNLEKRFSKMTIAGSYASLVFSVLGIIPLFLANVLPVFVYCFLSVWLPVSVYFLLGNILPMTNEGYRNDGALIKGLKLSDDESKVLINILKIQSELYNGKTPGEIDDKIYFDVPQLPEDNINFVILLNYRYAYYLDKEDYINLKKVSDRLEGLIDDLPKEISKIVYADILYNSCTFDKNESKADNIMEDLDRYLNNNNSITNLRIKLAYLVYILKDFDKAEMFFQKTYKEINLYPIKGLALYEKKLIDKIKDFINENNKESDKNEENLSLK